MSIKEWTSKVGELFNSDTVVGSDIIGMEKAIAVDQDLTAIEKCHLISYFKHYPLLGAKPTWQEVAEVCATFYDGDRSGQTRAEAHMVLARISKLLDIAK